MVDGSVPEAAGSDRRILPRTSRPMPDAIRLLEEVPPHRLAGEIVRLAQEAAGCPVALYVVDIGGSALRRMAGQTPLPDDIPIPQVLGPQLSRGRMRELQDTVAGTYANAVAFPLWVFGRAVAVLITESQPAEALEPLARQAAAAFELADHYTDEIRRARRRRRPAPGAEIQDNLVRPRLAELEGAEIAAAIVPAYDVGGDWYDYAQNHDGIWFAIADAVGKGAVAAAASAVSLGALRSSRAARDDLLATAVAMDRVLKELSELRTQFSTAILGHFDPVTGAVAWLRLGHPVPLLVDASGGVTELETPGNPPLGVLAPDEALQVTERVLAPGEQFILTSDGVWERRTSSGELFELKGIKKAIATRTNTTAAATGTALVTAIAQAATSPPSDDATVLVLAKA